MFVIYFKLFFIEQILADEEPQYASAPIIPIFEPIGNIPSCSGQSQSQEFLCHESNRMELNTGSDDEYFDDSDIDPTYEVEKENQQSSSGSDDFDYSLNDMASQIERNLSASESDTSTIEKETQKYRKLKRNSGKAYATAKGIKKAGRICKPLGKCRKKCNLKIDYENQKKLFHEYWGLKEYNLRASYVAGLIDIVDKKQSKTDAQKFRRFSCQYYLKNAGNRFEVCQKCFTLTFGESQKFLRCITQKLFVSPGTFIKDLRGNHSGEHRKLPETTIEAVKAHINSFPAYESHYTRRKSEKRYLHADLNISLMYKLYCEDREKPVSIWKYTQIFNGMNIKFKKPKTDTCHTCDILKKKIELCSGSEKDQFISDQSKHHAAADNAFKMKDADKLLAKSNNSVRVYTFDLQKCLPTPNLETSVSFYKRLLWTYNLTIHDAATNQPFNYMWHEAMAKRGGNEIASCVYKHLKTLPPTINHVILYSDSCVGQNKNSFMAAMFMTFLQSTAHNIQYIDHKFLEVGHTHMECDTVHATIEKQKRKTSFNIEVPRDWFQFVRSIRSVKQFLVIEMTQHDIYDFSLIAKTKLQWRNVDNEKNKFSWHSVKWLRFTKTLGEVQYKNSLEANEQFKIINFSRRGISSITETHLKRCYNTPMKINTNKKNDLICLLPLISPEFHDFYHNLHTEDGREVHPDLTEGAEGDSCED